jgi:hypothetical protein
MSVRAKMAASLAASASQTPRTQGSADWTIPTWRGARSPEKWRFLAFEKSASFRQLSRGLLRRFAQPERLLNMPDRS